jgi:hypothetical protein
MTINRPLEPFELSGDRHELGRLVARIQTLTLELQAALRDRPDSAEVAAKTHTLDQLRWRLAAISRRNATDELGNAA